MLTCVIAIADLVVIGCSGLGQQLLQRYCWLVQWLGWRYGRFDIEASEVRCWDLRSLFLALPSR